MSNPDLSSPWFSTYGLPQRGQARVFAFPYSGAGASAYFQWAKHCQSHGSDFIGVQPPGRENRLREKPLTDLSTLLASLLPAITPLLNKPFVLFGHSMGALIAFELCRSLRKQGLPLPQHLYVSGFRAPDMPNPNKELHRLSNQGIIDNLRQYGGTPEVVLNNKELMAMFLPVLRADFALHETYRYQPEVPLPCPITALSGVSDSIIKPDYMRNWERQTAQRFEPVHYEGDHFFLHKQMSAILHRLQQALDAPPV